MQINVSKSRKEVDIPKKRKSHVVPKKPKPVKKYWFRATFSFMESSIAISPFITALATFFLAFFTYQLVDLTLSTVSFNEKILDFNEEIVLATRIQAISSLMERRHDLSSLEYIKEDINRFLYGLDNRCNIFSLQESNCAAKVAYLYRVGNYLNDVFFMYRQKVIDEEIWKLLWEQEVCGYYNYSPRIQELFKEWKETKHITGELWEYIDKTCKQHE